MDKIMENQVIYQRMIEEIQDYAIILLDKDGFIRNWNKGAENIKLYTESEAKGNHFSIFYFDKDLDEKLPERLLTEAETAGKAYHEGWRKRKDGSGFWGSITITAMHDDDESIIGFVKVTRDLTEKKIAEDNLRMSEERYHQMIAEVQDYAIILLSVEGIVENWNSGAEYIKGYSSDEIIGKSFEIFYTPGDRRDNLPARLLQIARTNGKATQEGWRVRKDGTKFWGTIIITALHNKKNEIIGFSKVTRDLTDKKMAEEQLMAYTAELEIQNSELEQFAYVASHDLQEPLRKIRTFSGLIQENYDDKEFVMRYFEKLNLSASRMSELIKSLLNYSRLAKAAPESEPTDLNSLLKVVTEDMELLIQEKSARIISNDLPLVKGISIQLEQLFSNLIGNALKFSKENPRVEISSRIVKNGDPEQLPATLLEDTYFKLTFKDNGIGFEPEYGKLIFSLFQRLHERTDYEGTGIGLALCKKIVENHNGYIEAFGEPGKGATFTVYLPHYTGKAGTGLN